MFEDKVKNKKIIIGAYKKLKSYFYYDKTFLYNKMCIATLESEEKIMNERIENLVDFLTNIKPNGNTKYIDTLIQSVSFIPVPKSFKEASLEDNLLQNTISIYNEVEKVNFFIKAPIELMIIDTIWTMVVGKISSEKKAISKHAYANRIKKQVFLSNYDLYEGIDFDSNRLFKPYYNQYMNWRDNAFSKIKEHYKAGDDCYLLSIDFKGYYYSVTFKFEDLYKLLDNDERLDEIVPLTKIIEKIYINYTYEMIKYRNGINAKPDKQECIFPIGLLSSMILSNLYLRLFDEKIITKLNPSYYGRYVDDILIVIKRTNDIRISIDNILENTLVKNDIIKKVDKNEYQTTIPSGLLFQKEKLRCIYFDHNEPEAMIELLCESSAANRPSSAELMPDIDLSRKNFNDSAYNIGQREGALKIRNFLFTPNNYAATIFVNDLIKISKNVDIIDGKYKQYLSSQIKQIIKFYRGTQSIKYRSAWINVFTLILLAEEHELCRDFYSQIKCAINKIPKSKSIENIKQENLNEICDYIKQCLLEQLNLSLSIAVAPMDINVINLVFDYNCKEKDIIIQDARDIRKANMFNNHIISLPMINYIANYNIKSLVRVQPNDIFTSNQGNKLDFDENKLKYVPRFIHLDEICMFKFITKDQCSVCPSSYNIEEVISLFCKINSLPNLDDEMIFEKIVDYNDKKIQLQHIIISSQKLKEIYNLRIAIASICLDENKDILPTIKNPNHNLTLAKKMELYSLLNEAVKNKANMIVFPEFFLPIWWLEEICIFSRKNSISIISGLNYIVYEKNVHNYISVIQPMVSEHNFRYVLPLIREKNHYAPKEQGILCGKYQLECIDPKISYLHLVEINNICYSDLLCYELTDIEYRFILRSKIELLMVPEVNPDTEYFSNIVEATARDLHCFVAQVNSSKYGDSRITGPFNSMFKDIVKIKGGENNVILIGTIDLKSLIDSRNGHIKNNNKNFTITRRMKSPSAGFKNRKEENI